MYVKLNVRSRDHAFSGCARALEPGQLHRKRSQRGQAAGEMLKAFSKRFKAMLQVFSVPMPAEPDTAEQKITEVVPTALSPALFGSASLC